MHISLLAVLASFSAQQTAPVPSPAPPVHSLVRVDLARSPLALDELVARHFDVASVAKGGEHASLVCEPADRAELERLGVPLEVIHEDMAAFYAARASSDRARGTPSLGAWLSPAFGSGGMGGFYPFTEVVSVLDQIHAAYPAITTTKFSIGTSLEGRTLWALKLSDNPGSDEGEPEVRFDAMHHAREPQSMQCTLWTLLYLVENYGTDPLATYLVNEREIWFIPVVNPDGYVYNQSISPGGGGMWRKNRRNNGGGSFGIDLNRNYDYEWGFDDEGSSPNSFDETYRGPSPTSEPEIAAMQAFIDARSFQTALSAHTYSDLWLHPWGYIAANPANSAQYAEVSALSTEFNGYVTGPAGLVLYLANGVTIDYDHGTHGTMSWTAEIGGDGDGFWPAPSRIIPLAEENEAGFLRVALAGGAYVHESSRTITEVGDSDGFYEAGESVRFVMNVRNSGRIGAGAVTLGLSSSTPLVTVTQDSAALGAVGSFASANNAGTPLELALGPGMTAGTVVDYELTLTYQGYTQTFPATLSVGEPHLFLTDDLEVNLGWTAGVPGDAASTGIWAYGNPVGTFSGVDAANPENDATPGSGVNCFTTGNGSTSPGGDDVDGGPTTLVSPRFDLSGVASATLSYQRWFADLTTDDDLFRVEISDDDGTSWVPLETVDANANAWNEQSFDVGSFVDLTDEVRVRFIAADVPNNSVLEAAVDQFSIETFDTLPRLNFYGRTQIGATIAVHVAGIPTKPYAIYYSTGTANISFPFGTLLIDPPLFLVTSGTIPANGLTRLVAPLPSSPSLIGTTLHCQALTTGPLRLSNRISFTFE